MTSRHEWWRVRLGLMRDRYTLTEDADAIDAALQYIAELEAEPSVDDWLESISIEPCLTYSEIEEIMAVDPVSSLRDWLIEHAKQPSIVNVETGDRL